MKIVLRILTVFCLVIGYADKPVSAAEGGYSNYIPGTYGDFGMALAPSETWVPKAAQGQLGAHIVSLRKQPPIKPGTKDPYEPAK
ncbi:MAG: hypothetical protein V7731_01875 [Amphritea sp.]